MALARRALFAALKRQSRVENIKASVLQRLFLLQKITS